MEAAFSGAAARSPSRQAGAPSIKTISERLRKELPGLRGFSETSIKKMRQFYEQWDPVISNSTATAAELQRIKSTITVDEIETTLLLSPKSPITIDDLELFGNLSFTHHVRILNGEKDVAKRWKYINWLLKTCGTHVSSSSKSNKFDIRKSVCQSGRRKRLHGAPDRG